MSALNVIAWCFAILVALFTAGCLGFVGIWVWIIFVSKSAQKPAQVQSATKGDE
jgi:hypothetical protein